MSRPRLRRTSKVVAVVLVVVAFAVFAAARHVVGEDSRRLLRGQAGEVGALLTNSFSGVDASLRALAAVADLADPGFGAFVQSARPLVVGQTRAIVLVAATAEQQLHTAAIVGDGVPPGPPTGDRAALMSRAMSRPGLVTGVIVDGARRRIGLARGPWPATDGWIVYQESAIDPGNPNQPTAAPAFRSLDVALYSSTSPNPANLVLSTTSEVPTGRATATARVPVGVDEWLVVASSPQPLAGAFATAVPWLLLVVGLATALLCSAMVEVVSRRRDYALALVADRTSELRASVRELEVAQAELVRHAHNDQLTGLANRLVLLRLLENALARATRNISATVVVMFIDLDRFKVVNDSLGHDAGDELLIAVGRRLTQAVRPGDTVARLGGDEFVVLCEGLEDERDAWLLAERLQEAMKAPFDLARQPVTVSVSIGLAIGGGESSMSSEDLIRNADLAMYRAKELGRDRVEAFDENMRSGAALRLERESALRRAVAEREFVVYYQPILELETSTVVGAEALVRWIRDGVVIAPDDFVPLAEDTGIITALGSQVLTEACVDVASWNASRPDRPPLHLSVNISARQLSRDELPAMVESALAWSGLDPSLLSLEITESTLMDVDIAMRALQQLKRLGVTLVVDDFGTGYSSLMYLRRLPVDVIKIDKSFVGGLGRSEEDSAIVAAVIRLAGALGLDTVAEGVETLAQRTALLDLGCRLGQGFLWHPPVPASVFDRWLAEHEAADAIPLPGALRS